MIRGVVFDLDGTLYCGDKAVDGAVDTVYTLLNAGLKIFYLTNNSGKSRLPIVGKLKDLGFPAKRENTYCASYAVAKYLAEKQFSPVYLIGTDGLLCELLEHCVWVEDSSAVAAVAVGLDPDFKYEKISVALEAIARGAKLVVANLDPCYPAGNDKILPGCGAMVGAIVSATGHKPDFIVGKPNIYMLELLCQEHGLEPTEICVVGDVPESDMQMAANFGCRGILFDPCNVFPEFPNRISSLQTLKGELT